MKPAFRFGLSQRTATSPAELFAAAVRAESVGYATMLFPDHLGLPAPMVAGSVVAAATERLRIGPFVLNNDLRNPVVLAHEAATLDLLSDGRLELGIGAGHIEAEYAAAGIAFDPAPIRIERLAESVSILRRLFAGERVDHNGAHYRVTGSELVPRPEQDHIPIVIGGNGRNLLTVAGRAADIVGFVGFTARKGGREADPTHFTAAGLRDRIGIVRRSAGSRFEDLELNVLVQRVVLDGDRHGAAAELVRRGYGPSIEALLDSPFVLIGTVRQIIDQLEEYRQTLGVTYWTVFSGRSDGFDAVVDALAGR